MEIPNRLDGDDSDEHVHRIYTEGLCESGWPGDPCTLPFGHEGPHSNEGPEDEARAARRRLGFEDRDDAG